MEGSLKQSLILSILLIFAFGVIYPLLVAGIGKLAPGKGQGVKIVHKGRVVGFELIGQRFSNLHYFHGRPSAVNYNSAGSGGSNKGPSNPDYLKTVQARIDTFLANNPAISKAQIPADLVTASASGLDPDISRQSAYVQIPRISKLRGIEENRLKVLVDHHIESPLWGFLGPEKVNVLMLNLALDTLR